LRGAAPEDMRRDELADFLRTRRERLTPADVGLPATARRRVRGLRREEVAELAEIGIAWYTSLEQGRPVTVSAQTLDGIASALRLTADERIHIFLLAGVNPPLASTGSDVVSPTLQTIVHSLHPQPVQAAPTLRLSIYTPAPDTDTRERMRHALC
jgi:transcriptional regulator with XRE-family HTH domain